MTEPPAEGDPGAWREPRAWHSRGSMGERPRDEVRDALREEGSLRARLGRGLVALAGELGMLRSVIYGVNARLRQIEVVAWHGLGGEHYRPRFGAGVVGRAALSKQQIVVPQVRVDPMALSELADNEDWLEDGWSQVALPLLSERGITGVLACYTLAGSELSREVSVELSAAAALFAEALLAALPREAVDVVEASAVRARRAEAVFEYANMVGASPAMRQIYEEVGQVARTNATTLIRGDSGTGKELVACAIHNNSDRAQQPLVKVNCAALPESLFESELFGHERGAYTGAHSRRRGRFELAERGTLFLDEIGELSPAMQAKLLRVLQAREFERVGGTETLRTDVRVIAATNRNLEERVASGAFRQDLYYRLNVFSITVPPLRGRRADIWALAEYFVGKYAAQHRRGVTGIASGAMDLLSEHAWPGNVRELENAIERAVVVCDGFVIQTQHLPGAIRTTELLPSTPRTRSTLREAVAELERRMLSDALLEARGNCSRAGRELGISERVVRYKAAQYGIDVQGLRGSD
jgi:Nif-specific regulatory protein